MRPQRAASEAEQWGACPSFQPYAQNLAQLGSFLAQAPKSGRDQAGRSSVPSVLGGRGEA